MKRRYTLKFTPMLVDKPLVGKLVKSFDLEINILNADVASGKGGMLVVEFEGTASHLRDAVAWLGQIGVVVSPMSADILFVQERCVDCGACTAVCQSGALSLDRNAKLVYDPTRCVVCGLCVHACPLRLFSIA
ncbi:MAG: NIL domain-containing protein [Sphaerochaetaceae bacterium]|jgi:ferredoxin